MPGQQRDLSVRGLAVTGPCGEVELLTVAGRGRRRIETGDGGGGGGGGRAHTGPMRTVWAHCAARPLARAHPSLESRITAQVPPLPPPASPCPWLSPAVLGSQHPPQSTPCPRRPPLWRAPLPSCWGCAPGTSARRGTPAQQQARQPCVTRAGQGTAGGCGLGLHLRMARMAVAALKPNSCALARATLARVLLRSPPRAKIAPHPS